MRTASRRMLPVLATAMSVAGIAATSAQAAVVHVTGKSTTVTPSAQAAKFLSAHSITVSALGTATLAGGSLTLPISHGHVTTPRHNGVLHHDGGVKFSNGKRSLVLRSFELVRATDKTVLTAKFEGVRLIIARVVKLKEVIVGNQATVTGTLKLSVAAARGINHLFGHHLVAAGANIGTLSSTITLA
jgi:hypothetical protein